MARFVIAPHMRLQEWVAEEKSYFAAEGLDYEFHEALGSAEGKDHQLGNKVGAYPDLRKGSRLRHRLRLPLDRQCLGFRRPRQTLRRCVFRFARRNFCSAGFADSRAPQLAGVPISVGYQSGSHYSAIQALEQYLKPADIRLSFADGLLFSRMELLIDRKVPAASRVQRSLLFPRAARLPQNHRHDLHDGFADSSAIRTWRT